MNISPKTGDSLRTCDALGAETLLSGRRSQGEQIKETFDNETCPEVAAVRNAHVRVGAQSVAKRPRCRWPGNLDPRYYQIAALALLLLFGLLWLRFDLQFSQGVLILATVLLTQMIGSRIWRLAGFDPRSALISGLSLCLLVRTNSLALAGATALVTIAGKFVLRWRGKHIFNPTNFGIVVMILLSRGSVWVSPGQWGDFAFFSFLVICLGGLVVTRAARADVTLAFLGAWSALLFGRSLWLGEPMTIPLHRLHNGALLIFAFFMISDSKTTPNSRAGRILFASLVALGAAFVQFKLFRTNGLLWSLAAFSSTVPIMDWLLPGKNYQWKRMAPASLPESETKVMKGNVYETV